MRAAFDTSQHRLTSLSNPDTGEVSKRTRAFSIRLTRAFYSSKFVHESARTPSIQAFVSNTIRNLAATPHMKNESEPCWLYFIECRSGAIYIGIARDVDARYNLHASGKGARYTRMDPPVRLIGARQFPNRTEAAREEIRLKQLTASEKWKLIETLFVPGKCAPVSPGT